MKILHDWERGRGPACGATLRANQTEGEGFEPSSDPEARNGFRDRRIRPLCHPSARRHSVPGRGTKLGGGLR